MTAQIALFLWAKKGMIKTCVIGLGSNDPGPARILSAQSALRAAFPGVRFSTLRQTRPVGFPSPRWFHNQVALCTTALTRDEMTAFLKQMETAHGRRPEDKARGIVKLDLDLLCYDGEVLKPEDWVRDYVKEGVAELGI